MSEMANKVVAIWVLKQLELKGLLDSNECAAVTEAYFSLRNKPSSPAA